MMKWRFLFLAIFYCLSFYGQSYNSVLSEGTWHKFSVSKTGVYKIDANFLRSLGISIANINPKNIKIYGNGGQMLPELVSQNTSVFLKENAIYVKGEGDGVFNNSDYILFYAKGSDHWVVNSAEQTASHRKNIYNEKAYYFLTIGKTEGKRIKNRALVTGGSSKIITSFNDFVFHEKDLINLFALGREWFGEDLSVNNTQSIQINYPNASISEPLKIKVRAVVASPKESIINIAFNGKNIGSLSFQAVSESSLGDLARTNSKLFSVNNVSDKNTITLTFSGLPSSKVFLDYIELMGKRKLIANNNQFLFRNFDVANYNGIVEYTIKNKHNIFEVWDVTNHQNPKRISNKNAGNTFSFKEIGGTLKEYVVINKADFYTPEIIGNSPIKNQNLQALKNIQYLVITNNLLKNQGQRLANYHLKNSNLTSKVVTLNEIYNEFSSGSDDIVGIRNFIKHLHTSSDADKKLTYVCFFGDSSYDYKNRIPGNNNIVPTYHSQESFSSVNSYVTDDFFVMISDADGGMKASDNADIASGRIPVSSISEATAVVDKILSYYKTDTFGDWRNVITMVADDIDQEADKFLQSDVEKLADSIKKHKPHFNIKKIYADAYKQENSPGGERYPDVKNDISNALEKGTLVFDYFGHGGEDGLASERILDIPQIEKFTNSKKLPLFITVTCELSRFDNPMRNTAGERLFTNPKGGAVSMITTTRDILIGTGSEFNQKLTKEVFNFDNKNLSIAQNLINTKEQTNSKQKFFIYYFGDPAMKLAIPKPNILITKLNGKSVNEPLDTIKALSKIKLEGVVTDEKNNPLTNFNGVLSTIVYDKAIEKQTLDNDGFGVINTFDSQESKLFKGKATVTNGKFLFEFIAPKDLKTAYGKGKISLYAHNKLFDKSGANFNITIGGVNKNAPSDTKGPEIKLFINDESFVEGGKTNSSPNLIVKLFDESGINTSVTAVDHDIVAYLDDDKANQIILNDYYETELNDYKNGKVTYRLRNLKPGNHTITVKAWDTYNNSSEATLSFVVVDDSELYLSNVLNYPNPFINYTEFWFTHNKPNTNLEVQIQIFSVTGKLIKTINEVVNSNGTLSRNINWNGLDDFGNKIGKGTYVYKLKVKSTEDDLFAERIQKLVILQ